MLTKSTFKAEHLSCRLVKLEWTYLFHIQSYNAIICLVSSVTTKPFQHKILILTIPGYLTHQFISWFANGSKWLPHNNVFELNVM